MSQQINLFNPIFLKQKKIFSAVNMVDALAVLLVGSAAFYAYASIETLNLDRQSVETARQYYQAKARLSEAVVRYTPKKPDPGLELEVAGLQAQLGARKAALASLSFGQVENGVGYAQYMQALARQSLAGLWLTGFKVAKNGAEMEIVGRALQPELVPAYIQRLNRERALHGRAFDTLSMALREDKLPAEAGRAGGAAADYVYTEFRLSSAQAAPGAGLGATAAPAAAPVLPPHAGPGGGAK